MGIDPRSQVRHLIQGIKITELDAVQDQIMETASFRTDCDGCISVYKTFIVQRNNISSPDLNISGLESSNHKEGGQKKRVEDVYYSKEEYKALSSDQITALYKKRQVRGHKPEEKKVNFKGGGPADELLKQVSVLLAVMTSAPETPVTDPPTTNSNNTTLTGQIIFRG